MAKVKFDSNLYERIKKVAEEAGYANADEFVIHVVERELSVLESADSDQAVTDRLKGLGYIE